MDFQSKKKIKIILIEYLILIIPTIYIVAVLYAYQIKDKAYYLSEIKYPSDLNVTKKSISTIDKAIRICPWNSKFRTSKAWLQFKLKDYRGVLNSLKQVYNLKGQNPEILEFQGQMFEYLNRPDSSKII